MTDPSTLANQRGGIEFVTALLTAHQAGDDVLETLLNSMVLDDTPSRCEMLWGATYLVGMLVKSTTRAGVPPEELIETLLEAAQEM